VTAFNSLGPGAPSNVASVTTPPTAPTDLTATYSPGLQVLLTWTDTSTYEEGFVIERIEGDITIIVATVGPGAGGTQTYTDATIAFDGAYAYQVYAFNASGNSALAGPVAVDAPPLAPLNLTAAYDSGVLLTWYDNSVTETGFSVQRCTVVAPDTTCANFAEIAAPGPLTGGQGIGNVSYLDEGVVAGVMPNTTYRYYVAAVNGAGPSDPSNIAPFTTPNFPPAPVPVTITHQSRKITVTWTSVPVANGYTIQWSTDSGSAPLQGPARPSRASPASPAQSDEGHDVLL